MEYYSPIKRNTFESVLMKWTKLELLHDPAISLLGICLEENMIQKDTCTPMFTAALFTTAKTWKQPKCSSIEEKIKKI